MSKKIHVRPLREGVVMPELNGTPMPKAGAHVVLDAFYAQMLRWGDIEKVKTKSVKKTKEVKADA